MQRLQLLLQVTRARTLPVMIAPIVLGAVLAWEQGIAFQIGFFLLTLIGALAAHLGANVTNDVFDFAEGTDQAAQEMSTQGEIAVTGSQPLMKGMFSLSAYRRVAIALFALALLCGLVLSVFRPWVLVFGIAGFLLAFFYVAPPLRLAYIGRGLGELDILLSFGILPLLGAYYVQANTITLTAVLASLPIGLYTTAVLYFHHFLHWRADLAVKKMTPIVVLGEHRARVVGALIIGVTGLLLLIDAWLQVFPWYSCVSVLTIIPVLVAIRQATGPLKYYIQLMATNLNANLQTAIVLLIALLIRGTTHL